MSLSVQTKIEVSEGVVHKMPADLRDMLLSNAAVREIWEDLTPLARNEWICWIEEAKKLETRARRLPWLCESLLEGKRRPCCWAGCPHRGKKMFQKNKK